MKKNNPPPPYGGILNMWKPVGISSMDLIRDVRRALGIKKIGHTGTLDPFAEGVLPMALGRSTNMIRYMEDFDKVYEVLVHFGQSTDTQDFTGEVLSEHQFSTSELQALEDSSFEIIRDAISKQTGRIEQITPQYSAAKIDGKAMYQYAREGINIEGKSREIEIFHVDILDISSDKHFLEHEVKLQWGRKSSFFADENFQADTYIIQDNPIHVNHSPLTAVLRIHCSKGTYIRTWVHDLGQVLGYGAFAEKLRRVRSGPYAIKQAHRLSDLKDNNSLDFSKPSEANPFLLSPGTAREDLAVIELDEFETIDIINGKMLVREVPHSPSRLYRLYFNACFIGLARSNGSLKNGSNEEQLVAERIFTSLENFTN